MKRIVSGILLMLLLMGTFTLAIGIKPVLAQGEISPIATSVSCSPNPAHINSPVTCTAVISSPYATGTVTWSSNSSTGSFNPSVCTVSSGNLSGIVETCYCDSVSGSVAITASYSGDWFNMPSNGSTVLVVGQEEQSSTYAYCSLNIVPVLVSANCTAWVSGFDPAGNVTWSSNSSTGSFSSPSCTLLSGECSTTYTDSMTGTVTITAVYSGNSENKPSNGSTMLVVSGQSAQSCTIVYCKPSPVPVNGAVDCIAEVSGYDPAGNLTWSSNSSTGFFSPSVCPLSSGNCATIYTDTCTGTVLISASYSGDLFNAPSNGSNNLEVVGAMQSSIYILPGIGRIVVNGSISCMAMVSGFNPDGYNPGGNITWTSNSSTGCFSSPVCAVSPVYAPSQYYMTDGACFTYYTDSSAGTVLITASYGGDLDNAPSSASTILFVSTPAQQSSTYVDCRIFRAATVHVNVSVICQAIVFGYDPTGTVTWSSNSSTGSFSYYSNVLQGPGYCPATYTDSSAGTVLITASYSGDSNNMPSNGSTILVVSGQLAQSSISVCCSPDPAHVNGSVICSAFVSGDNPTGTVSWWSNSSTGSFSDSSVSCYGSCTVTYTDSGAGTVLISASYGGDSENAPSSGSTDLVETMLAQQSSTYVSSSSSSCYADCPVTLSAGVSGFSPTGPVSWWSNSSAGVFTSSVCPLSSGTCSTSYTDSNAGTAVIIASYSGDSNNIQSSCTMTLKMRPQPPSKALLNVPYHQQLDSYYCGPAALEEVFNFYGPDISQDQIASVARTTPAGTFDTDLIRAAEFSNLSNSAEGQSGSNSSGFAGYSGRNVGYAALDCYGMSVEDLKAVIAAGYPVIVLTTWHFRVAVGYDETHIIFQDPYYGSLYEMTYDSFSSDWDYSGHEGILVCPWQIEISNPHNVLPRDTFNVTATIVYPEVYPFQFSSEASSVNATIMLPSGLTLATGETAQKICESDFELGQSFTVTWQVQCQALGEYRIGVYAEGIVSGNMPAEPPAYPQSYSYQDRIGGTNESVVGVTLDTTPPITTADYDGSWQNHPFTINLTASDDNSGVLETYYRINGGPEQTLTLNGEPIMRTPGANNTLEYWSVDRAGNEELPHKLLMNIKLDETPPSLSDLLFTPFKSALQPSQAVGVTVYAIDDFSGLQNVTLLYSLNSGVSWIFQAMSLNQSTFLFGATIPGQPMGTLVRFYVEAFDWAGNAATLRNEYYYFAYEIPPLRVTNITSCGWIYRGRTACVNVTISDIGDFPEDVWVTLYYNLTADNIVDAYPVHLEAGQSYTLVFPWNTAGIPCLNYTLTAVATIPTGNATLSGETIAVRIMGDTNGDGRVDMKDIALIARCLGSTPTSPNWNPAADINGDGVVNMKDIAIVARNFGQHYP